MDNKQLMHMACEGIVIGGVSLYFAKQLKQANKEIEELKSIIAKNQAANEKRFEVLFNVIDNLTTTKQPEPQYKPVVKKPQKKVVRIQQPKVSKEAPKEEEPKEEDEVVEVVEDDLEEETRALLEEDIDEDIDA
jgi:hypothetical protein